MECYQIKNKRLLFYGAGTNANVLTERLEQEAIQSLSGYIDKRGEALREKNGFPVYAMAELEDIREKDAYAIIVTTRNVFEHSKIANELFDLGFQNIVFKPLSCLRGSKNQVLTNISVAHDDFFVRFKTSRREIPVFKEKEQIKFHDSAVYAEEQDYYHAYLPACLVFTNEIKDIEANFPDFLLASSNFITNYIAVDLYKSFARAGEDFEEVVDEYIRLLCDPFTAYYNTDTSGNWKELLVHARLDVYHQMNRSLALDGDFFKRNPTTIGYNKDGNLCLTASGKNRVSFLISKGFSYIPAKIKKEDYHRFLNEIVFEKTKEYIEKNTMNELFAPIPHPYFYEVPSVASDYVAVCISRLAHEISYYLLEKYGTFDFSSLSVIDDVADNGELGRHFTRLGCNMVHLKERPLTVLLDQLFHVEEKEHKGGIRLLVTEAKAEKSIDDLLETQKPDLLFLLNWDKETKAYCEYSLKKEIFTTVWQEQLVTGILYERKVPLCYLEQKE